MQLLPLLLHQLVIIVEQVRDLIEQDLGHVLLIELVSLAATTTDGAGAAKPTRVAARQLRRVVSGCLVVLVGRERVVLGRLGRFGAGLSGGLVAVVVCGGGRRASQRWVIAI